MKDILHDLAYFRQDAGVLLVLGEKRKEFLNGLITNELAQSARIEAAFLTRIGKLLAYAVLYSLKHAILLVVTQTQVPVLFAYLQKKAALMHVTVVNKSLDFSVFSLLGTRATECVEKQFGAGQFIDNGKTLLAHHDGCYDIITSEDLPFLSAIPELGQEEQELFRITQGTPKWGIDMDENTLFPFLGLDNAVSYTKGCYVGQEVVARTKHLGKPARLFRQLVIEVIDGKIPPPQKTPVVAEGKPIGFVTSAVYSPCHQRIIAFGFLQKPYDEVGTEVVVLNKRAIVRALPGQGK